MMNLSQTKLVGLTMELDLKTREYKKLCDKLGHNIYIESVFDEYTKVTIEFGKNDLYDI